MLGSNKNKVEFVDSSVEREEIKGFSLKGMIDGSLLAGTLIARQLPMILFLVFFAIIYIGNRYHAEKMVRKIVVSREEVKNLRAEQLTTASELMNQSKPSTLEDLVKKHGLGLTPATKPPYKIVVKK
jgi:hypothetical protein